MTKKTTRVKKPTTVTENTNFSDLPELVTPEEAQAFLRISRNTTYDLLKTGALRSVKFGRLIRVPKAALLGENK